VPAFGLGKGLRGLGASEVSWCKMPFIRYLLVVYSVSGQSFYGLRITRNNRTVDLWQGRVIIYFQSRQFRFFQTFTTRLKATKRLQPPLNPELSPAQRRSMSGRPCISTPNLKELPRCCNSSRSVRISNCVSGIQRINFSPFTSKSNV